MMPQLYTGAKVSISIGGKLVAAAFVADYSIRTKASELETIDNVFPAELAPERIQVELSLKVYRHPDNDPVLDKIVAGSGSLGQSEQTAFTQAPYIYLEIKDHNDQTILHVPKAWVNRRSGAMSAGDFLTEIWAVSGIGYFGPQN